MSIGGMNLEEFLNHQDGGSRGAFLKSWKEDGKGETVVWVHPGTDFRVLLAHPWFGVREGKSKETDEQELFVARERFVCYEKESVVDRQFFRDEDTGEREYPPIVCPFDFMLEWLYGQVVIEEKIDITTPIFRFEGDDPEKVVTLHAGGILGLFNRKDISKQEIQRIAKAGIKRSEAWREKLAAKKQFLFLVVSDHDPGAGVVKAIEGKELKQKFVKAIKDQIEARKDNGNPIKNPYPFRWKFDKDRLLGHQYDVVALTEEKPSDEVLEQLQAEAPDISEETEPGDCAALRASFEQFALVDMPFDDFFERADKAGLMKSKAGKTTDKRRTPEVRGDDESGDNDSVDSSTAQGGEDVFQCDYCDGETDKDDIVCPHCGATYDEKTKRLDGLPCLSERCKGKQVAVPLIIGGDDYAQSHICETCGTIHLLSFETMTDEHGSFDKPKWSVKPEEKKPEPSPAGRRRRAASSAAEPPKEAEQKKPEAKQARRRGNGKAKSSVTTEGD